jgi:adenylate kinase family enzyme
MNTNVPNITVVTGPPGSGKTTLAHKLSKEIGCPAICRDEIKEGFVITQNKSHDELGNGVNAKIYDVFFEIVNTYLRYEITVVIEAAFQRKLWAPRLNEIKNVAKLKLLICDVDPLLAFERRQRRLLANPNREKFHGEKVKDALSSTNTPQIYDSPSLDVPTLRVNTTNEYDPTFEAILHFIMHSSGQ